MTRPHRHSHLLRARCLSDPGIFHISPAALLEGLFLPSPSDPFPFQTSDHDLKPSSPLPCLPPTAALPTPPHQSPSFVLFLATGSCLGRGVAGKTESWSRESHLPGPEPRVPAPPWTPHRVSGPGAPGGCFQTCACFHTRRAQTSQKPQIRKKKKKKKKITTSQRVLPGFIFSTFYIYFKFSFSFQK